MEKEVLYEIGNKESKITTYKDGSMKVEGARIEINEPTQLDRIESKVDKILHILESGDLSTSFERELTECAENIARMSAYDRFKNL